MVVARTAGRLRPLIDWSRYGQVETLKTCGEKDVGERCDVEKEC